MPADEVEVHVPTLRAVAGELAGTADAIRREGGALADHATAAGTSCGAGPLAAALVDLAAELRRRTGEVAVAVAGAGSTLAGNAVRYVEDDERAAARFRDSG